MSFHEVHIGISSICLCKAKRSVLIVLLLIHCILCFSQSALKQFPRVPLIQNFNSEDYRGGIQNWGITQDTRGIIYIANNHGVAEFDGEDWRMHEVDTGTRTLAVYADENNHIYVGGQNQIGYFKSNQTGELIYYSLIELIDEKDRQIDNVWKVFTHNDNIVFSSDFFIYFYDGVRIKAIPFKSQGGYTFKVGAKLLAFSATEGLLEWNGRSFELLRNTTKLKTNAVVQVLPANNDNLLIFQTNGTILIYKNGDLHPWKTEVDSLLEQTVINTATLLSDNSIAIGSQNNGLIILKQDGSLVFHLTKSKGLNGSTIYGIHQDQFQNIWLGLNNGISCVDYGSPFSLIDERLGLPGTGYAAAHHDGLLYLGTNNGLYQQRKKDETKEVNTGSYVFVNNSEGQVYSIENHQGHLLVGHHRGGFKVENDEARSFYSGTGTWKYDALPEQDKFIAGTYSGFITISEDFQKVNLVAGFRESSRLFELIDQSNLWVSHGFKGVFKIGLSANLDSVASTEFYGDNRGFPSNLLINLFSVNNELLFPAETGVFKYSNQTDTFIHNTELEEILGDDTHISTFVSNNLGDIYYIKENRLGFLKADKFGKYEIHESKFNQINKYLSDDLENITIIDHENILIGAKQGFVHYNPTVLKRKIDNFSTLIRSIEITKDSIVNVFSGGTIDSLNHHIYDSDLNSIRFVFAAPYFDGFEDLVYQYQLKGFDTNWSEWSTQNHKEYTNLGSGKYVLKVRAKNIYGDISHEASYHYSILPPWYRTKTAYLLYSFSIIIVFGFAMYVLDTKHRQDKKKMAINQERAIHKKDLQIKSVSEESEAKLTQLRNEKLRAEVDFKNKELASSTMHLLNKNELMLGIKSTLESVSKESKPKPEEIRKIIKNIDRNISEDRDWEQFTKHFDQVHGDFLKKLKAQYPLLTPQETKLAAYLRMNLASKEVAQLLNISVRGVEISRYRLRKKLAIEREINLVSFLMDI